MEDITKQIKDAVSAVIRIQLLEVEPFCAEYRKFDDLRVKLKKVFPKEKQLDSIDSAVQFIQKLLKKEDIRIKTDFENRRTKEIFVVYSIPSASTPQYRPKDCHHSNKISKKDKNDVPENIEATSKFENLSEGIQFKKSELKKFAFFHNYDRMLERIALLAKPEPWSFGRPAKNSQFPILEAYLNRVIERLKYEKDMLGYENKIVTVNYQERDSEGKLTMMEKCIINTGLLSRRDNYIYMIFDKNNHADAQEWFFKFVSDDAKSQSLLPFKDGLPAPAKFYVTLSRSTVIYSKDVMAINIDHILTTHCERLPIGFLRRYFSDFFEQGQSLETAEDWDNFKKYIKESDDQYEYVDAMNKLHDCISKAQNKALNDDSARALIYRPKEHSVGFFLPLYLEKPKDEKDFEIGVIIDNSDGQYIARTIYQTSMAYDKIRVMGNHKRPWLDPERIKNWKDPYSGTVKHK